MLSHDGQAGLAIDLRSRLGQLGGDGGPQPLHRYPHDRPWLTRFGPALDLRLPDLVRSHRRNRYRTPAPTPPPVQRREQHGRERPEHEQRREAHFPQRDRWSCRLGLERITRTGRQHARRGERHRGGRHGIHSAVSADQQWPRHLHRVGARRPYRDRVGYLCRVPAHQDPGMPEHFDLAGCVPFRRSHGTAGRRGDHAADPQRVPHRGKPGLQEQQQPPDHRRPTRRARKAKWRRSGSL